MIHVPLYKLPFTFCAASFYCIQYTNRLLSSIFFESILFILIDVILKYDMNTWDNNKYRVSCSYCRYLVLTCISVHYLKAGDKLYIFDIKHCHIYILKGSWVFSVQFR